MNKPTLSPSKLTTYLACPVRYRWAFVDPRGKWYVRSRATYSFGTTLHQVLATFHARGAVDTVDEVLSTYEENWLDAGYSSAEEMAEAFGDGKEILETYVEEARRSPATAQTLFVERTLKRDMGEFELVGRIDRVDRTEAGIEIIDYKTGASAPKPDEAAHSLALGCYALLLEAQYPATPISATLVALRSGARSSATFEADVLRRLEATIVEIAARIMDPEQDPAPSPKALCRTCDFLPLCRKDTRWVEPDQPPNLTLF